MNTLLEVRSLRKTFVKRLDLAARFAKRLGFNLKDEKVTAVDGVDFSVSKGEVVGLVGESGCGKSTLGRMVAGILPSTSGKVLFRDEIVRDKTKQRKGNGLKIQMIFQDPFASLNPRQRVKRIIGEAPLAHGLISRDELTDYVVDIMEQVGLNAEYQRRYPHQFSGGQRQRIGIARALALKPEFLVCDEAIAALDVSIQAQVINLFMDLQKRLNLTYLFISHDLSVVEHISDRVMIMYLGRIVESAATDDLYKNPNHPYTQALLREMPSLDSRNLEYRPIKGEIPSPLNPPMGCSFHPRCPYAEEQCQNKKPQLDLVSHGHFSACHLNEKFIH